jgi:hypothetical protein
LPAKTSRQVQIKPVKGFFTYASLSSICRRINLKADQSCTRQAKTPFVSRFLLFCLNRVPKRTKEWPFPMSSGRHRCGRCGAGSSTAARGPHRQRRVKKPGGFDAARPWSNGPSNLDHLT